MEKTGNETWQLRATAAVVGGALFIILTQTYLRSQQIESVERYAFFCVIIGAVQGFAVAMLVQAKEAQVAIYGSLGAFALGLAALAVGLLGETGFFSGVLVVALMWLVTVPGSYLGAYIALHMEGKNKAESSEPEPPPQVDRSFKIR